MSDIYIFSGLGVDERVFKNIDFGAHQPKFINWIIPTVNETIESYANRLLVQIPTERPILIGLSFGGMMAIEVSKLIKTEKLILLATAKTRAEIPYYYKLAGIFSLQKWIPISFLKKANFISFWFFDANNKKDRELLKNILIDTNNQYLKWALNQIVYWQNKQFPDNTIHIHGTNDKVIPYKFVKCDIEIKNGGHFMTVQRGEEISEIIGNLI